MGAPFLEVGGANLSRNFQCPETHFQIKTSHCRTLDAAKHVKWFIHCMGLFVDSMKSSGKWAIDPASVVSVASGSQYQNCCHPLFSSSHRVHLVRKLKASLSRLASICPRDSVSVGLDGSQRAKPRSSRCPEGPKA